MNNYSYKDIELWSDKTWENTDALIHPIVSELIEYNFKNIFPNYKSNKFKDRQFEVLDHKSNAAILDDVINDLNSKNLEFHCTSMGFVEWVAILPKKRNRNTKLLVVFTSFDTKNDPLWAMELIEYYHDYVSLAGEKDFAILFLVQAHNRVTGIYTDIILEVSALWKIDMKEIYLEAKNVKKEYIGFKKSLFYGIEVFDITNKWQASTAHQYICLSLNKNNKEFDADHFVHSPLGKRIAESLHLEKKYRKWNDEGLIKEIDEKGLAISEHYTQEERWLSITPKEIDRKIPLLICMKEVRPVCEFQALTALQFYYDYLDIAGNKECALLFFALESPDDNDLLVNIIEEMCSLYPIDRERIYITGQSHNGCFALEFARRHHDLIAAVATLNDRHGFASPRYSVDNVKISDSMLDDFASFDLPLINICGQIENVFPHTVIGSEAYLNQVDALHRRFKAFKVHDYSDKEIKDALNSKNKVTRINGLPSDRTEIIYTMGFEAYVSDYKNSDGNYYLRLVTLENLPHMITPQMVELSWSFLRRFCRKSDGSIVERDK